MKSSRKRYDLGTTHLYPPASGGKDSLPACGEGRGGVQQAAKPAAQTHQGLIPLANESPDRFLIVIPAKAGIQYFETDITRQALDSRLRGNDDCGLALEKRDLNTIGYVPPAQPRANAIWLIAVIISIVFSANAGWCATKACAHRGDTQCAPENTLPAIESAVKKGAHMIEFDVQLTKDGQMVLMHDGTINRTTSGKGKVSDWTYAELQQFDAGRWFNAAFEGVRIPLFSEALNVVPHSILCNIHLKGDVLPLGRMAAGMIKDMDRLDHCFLACTLEQAAEARAAVPDIRICNMSRQDGTRKLYVDSTIEQKMDYIQLLKKQGIDNLKEDVDRLHAHGVLVNFFSAQEESLIRTLADAGVDFILTDNLELCLKLLAGYGTQPVPRQATANNHLAVTSN